MRAGKQLRFALRFQQFVTAPLPSSGPLGHLPRRGRRWCVQVLPALYKVWDTAPLRGFFFSLYNRIGFCYNVKDYDMIKGDTHEIFDRSDL